MGGGQRGEDIGGGQRGRSAGEVSGEGQRGRTWGEDIGGGQRGRTAGGGQRGRTNKLTGCSVLNGSRNGTTAYVFISRLDFVEFIGRQAFVVVPAYFYRVSEVGARCGWGGEWYGVSGVKVCDEAGVGGVEHDIGWRVIWGNRCGGLESIIGG